MKLIDPKQAMQKILKTKGKAKTDTSGFVVDTVTSADSAA